MMMRNFYRCLWAFTIFILPAYSAIAQPYPDKPITIVIPMGAGGASDVLMRTISPVLSSQLGQSIIVDNRPGANGLIGEEYFARAKPDGYTWMLGTASATTNLWMHKLSYDPRQAFVPVMKIAAVPMALVVNSSKVPSRNVKDFVNFAKASSPSLTYGTWGEGSVSHLTMELFKGQTKVNLSHIPYKTSPQALNDVIAGQVDTMFIGLAAANQQASSGKLSSLAITSPVRSPIAPQIPIMAESGFPGVEFESWFGVFVPAGTPPSLIKTIHQALEKTLAQADLKSKLAQAGYRVIGDSPESFAKYYQNEIISNEQIIKAAAGK
jgi:tripartite-type tricarboxylate transporter receptor subunit TctC